MGVVENDVDPMRRNKRPRPLSQKEKERLDEYIDLINYSARYDISAHLNQLKPL